MRLRLQIQPKFSPLILLPLFSASTVVAQTNQQQPVTLQTKGAVSVPEFLRMLSKQVKLRFVYNADELQQLPKITVNAKNEPLDQVLSKALGSLNVSYNINNGVLVVRYAQAKSTGLSSAAQTQIVVTGKVYDDNGKPLEMATIREMNSARGTYTNSEGEYTFTLSQPGHIIISYVGMEPQREKITKPTNLTTKLSLRAGAKEVVVTGIVTRQKDSYTGAVATFTGAELKTIGNNNILQSLKTLDPSFIMMENNLAGSNPNVLPNIEIRGTTSISTTGNAINDAFASDPNQPLFIMDGFETTLRVIADLDMNRVKSVTILKDAGSTAIYGAKAANGVVVIETLRPTPGKLRLSYTADFRAEIPDLSGYNMMNATEKLEFERLAGRYSTGSDDVIQEHQEQYNKHLAAILRGVNTYWLSEPLQTGLSHGHSIYTDGGSNDFTYGLGLNYKKTSGAMKGSGRDTWGGNIDLTYRKKNLNISNKLFVSGYNSAESNYGSFANWVNANPYYEKTGDKYLDTIIRSKIYKNNVVNPLYEANILNFNKSKSFGFTNNFQIQYNLNREFRAEAGIQVSNTNTVSNRFVSPLSAQFDNVSVMQKGRFDNSNSNRFNYQASAMITYAKVINKHMLTMNLRTAAEEEIRKNLSFSAVGFPTASNGNPAFAFGYRDGDKPSASEVVFRRLNFNGMLNYVYNGRYALDMNYRIDGTTSFGRDNKFTPFWSFGASWNLHNEDFIRNEYPWITMLKIRGTVGTSSNVNMGSFSSVDVYNYFPSVNLDGQGVELNAMGNAGLKWQTTKQSNIGVDVSLWNNRLSLNAEKYWKPTNPLVVMLDMPSSTGVVGYPINTGELYTSGFELKFKYAPIYNLKDRIILSFNAMGTIFKSEYRNFNNSLYSLNTKEQSNSSLQRYYDGASPSAIWVVPSMGIDPATGKEVFMKLDGTYTFTYDAKDVRVMGDTKPTAEGVFGTSFTYKQFNLSANFRYRFGGDIFNTALFDKVENISYDDLLKNQDRRALYDRWKKPGDQASFKSIAITDDNFKSSRFVQEENVIIGESFNLGYTLRRDESAMLKKIGLSSLRFNAYMNDIFRLSSIQVERGINYPFANTVAFSIGASF